MFDRDFQIEHDVYGCIDVAIYNEYNEYTDKEEVRVSAVYFVKDTDKFVDFKFDKNNKVDEVSEDEYIIDRILSILVRRNKLK